MALEAALSLKGEYGSAIGRDRIQLLEAVARTGSITAGAKAVGLSYKAAWDALDAMANLFGKPLLATRAGGRAGGGASLTETGVRVIEAFHRLESGLSRLLDRLEPELAGTGVAPRQLVSGLLMRTSARNALRGRITQTASDALMTEVGIAINHGAIIHALVTNHSARELGLCPGREAIALIKAPFVLVAPGAKPPAVSARNCLPATILRCSNSPRNAEVVLDLGSDKTLVAIVPAHSATTLGLTPGMAVHALFDAAHVIVAID